MIDNPFAVIERRFNRQEFLLEELLKLLKNDGKQSHPDRCNKEQALKFLNDQGCKISESQLYKKTAAKEIPFKTFGRQLIFSRKELLVWLDSQTVDKRNTGEIELTLARSSRRKKKGGANA
ncbi:DNA-binding protein [Rufibacter immobilis]|uniref:DNA-binding protein n=1 Tax=Rufibacter immobilis TaxID=1348778 RepID=A0A3M9MW77_9BACT|nr:helix-turn-helix domain-containing protein [Rufibacter immobilis]RNI29779.1 DNA-binding protein [Rufibacter immobilis]